MHGNVRCCHFKDSTSSKYLITPSNFLSGKTKFSVSYWSRHKSVATTQHIIRQDTTFIIRNYTGLFQVYISRDAQSWDTRHQFSYNLTSKDYQT